ncbi:L-type lectin-domain containing receptor kinase IX.1-like [Eucalyptus grandis]|uniref:L-type lectin-domain containing receptor kinase IX.1-like n=1 Tax=Eucalyptus grandis TaxID=71139 RepID=UPI00192ED5BD|nr:L-type lectin-domain containing receptor kinase IX.1-like [Eucalyptus grandis]
MRSFGRDKDQPQPPTPALILLVLTISLLKPFSASTLPFANPRIMLPYGFATYNRLALQGNASERPPYLSLSQPNGRLDGIGGPATYSGEVHFWDKATVDAVNWTSHSIARPDCQQRNPFGNKLASLAVPLARMVAFSLEWKNDILTNVIIGFTIFTGRRTNLQPKEDTLKFNANFGHLACPDSDCFAVNINCHSNTSGMVAPLFFMQVIDVGFGADVQTAIEKVTKDGSSSSIMYDPYTKCSGVVSRVADGTSGNEIRHHYCPFSSGASMQKTVGVCVIASPESALGHRVVQISGLVSGSQLQVEKATDSWLKWLFIVMGGVVVLVAIIVAWVNYRSEVSSPDRERGGEEGNRGENLTEEFEKLSGTKKFSYEDLMIATDSFARNRILGEGGFGAVYKGYMGGARTVVAVKKIKFGSRQGVKEYISEVKSLSQLRHRNVVQLIGYCHKASEFVLVYEFMTGGSLEDHLFKNRTLLTWERRYNIALGLASALHYLQKLFHQCVIHRDIKSSNIMLDEEVVAKLGDFGLAKLVNHARGPNTTQVKGTLGYLAPEYHQMGVASRESDVYSFGVVLLEIVCGRRVFDSELGERGLNLVQWVWKRYGSLSLGGRGELSWRWRNKFLEVVDPRLGKDFDKKRAEALLIVGLWCAHPIAASRPSIEEAMAVLNLKAEPPKLPPKMPRFNVN